MATRRKFLKAAGIAGAGLILYGKFGAQMAWALPRAPACESSETYLETRYHPEEVTTVIMQFKLPSVPFAVPSSLRIGGSEYVWHCHILEHEEHDMMRPLVVL